MWLLAEKLRSKIRTSVLIFEGMCSVDKGNWRDEILWK
jgi:hypothetical protein